MPRKTEGPLRQLNLRLDLGPELGSEFEDLASRNYRSLSAEAMVAIREWVGRNREAVKVAAQAGLMEACR
jgi:hypothetical protein